MSVAEIAWHYNNVTKVTKVSDRSKSRIYYQRNFNNWVKNMLIDEATDLYYEDQPYGSLTILDICCGRGNDLPKWHNADIDEIVCVDAASESVKHCEQRYREMKNLNNARFDAHFITMDCTEQSLIDHLPEQSIQFDIVSCQMALHYAFRSEKALRQILFNVSRNLKQGGYFIGTIPDAERIVKLLHQTTDGKYSNDVLSIEYCDKSVEDWSTLQPPLFWATIHFSLDQQVNCPEFLAYFPLLEEICKDFDMELVSVKDFNDAIQGYNLNEQRDLITTMKALEEYPFEAHKVIRENFFGARKYSTEYAHVEKLRQQILNCVNFQNINGCLGTLSKSEWEVVALYQTFIFRKI